ncbi:hypothetical protein FA95DRAFT_1578910, partial [Auriscalpium vulgare]
MPATKTRTVAQTRRTTANTSEQNTETKKTGETTDARRADDTTDAHRTDDAQNEGNDTEQRGQDNNGASARINDAERGDMSSLSDSDKESERNAPEPERPTQSTLPTDHAKENEQEIDWLLGEIEQIWNDEAVEINELRSIGEFAGRRAEQAAERMNVMQEKFAALKEQLGKRMGRKIDDKGGRGSSPGDETIELARKKLYEPQRKNEDDEDYARRVRAQRRLEKAPAEDVREAQAKMTIKDMSSKDRAILRTWRNKDLRESGFSFVPHIPQSNNPGDSDHDDNNEQNGKYSRDDNRRENKRTVIRLASRLAEKHPNFGIF